MSNFPKQIQTTGIQNEVPATTILPKTQQSTDKTNKNYNFECFSCSDNFPKTQKQECLICNKSFCIKCIKDDTKLLDENSKKSKSANICQNCFIDSSKQRVKKGKNIKTYYTDNSNFSENAKEENKKQAKSKSTEIDTVQEENDMQVSSNAGNTKTKLPSKQTNPNKSLNKKNKPTVNEQSKNIQTTTQEMDVSQITDDSKLLDLDYLQTCVTPPSELYDQTINIKEEGPDSLKNTRLNNSKINNSRSMNPNANANSNPKPSKNNVSNLTTAKGGASLLRSKRAQQNNEIEMSKPRRDVNPVNYTRPEIKPTHFSNISNMVECHQCGNDVSLSNALNCTNKNCNKSYCLNCHSKYPRSTLSNECFYCTGVCKCDLCKKLKEKKDKNESLVLVESNYNITIDKSLLDSEALHNITLLQSNQDKKAQMIDIDGFCIIENNQSQDSENYVEDVKEEEEEEAAENDFSELNSSTYKGNPMSYNNFNDQKLNFNPISNNRKRKKKNSQITKKIVNHFHTTKSSYRYGNEKQGGNIIKIPNDKRFPFEQENRVSQILQRVCSNSALNPKFKTRKDCFICRQSNVISQYRFKCFTDFVVFCKQHFALNEYVNKSKNNEHLFTNIDNLNKYYNSYFLKHYNESSQQYKSVKYICHNCLEHKMFVENGFYELYNLMLLSNIKMDMFSKSTCYPDKQVKPNQVNFVVKNKGKEESGNSNPNQNSNKKNEEFENAMNNMNNFNLNLNNNTESQDIKYQINAILLINQIWQYKNKKIPQHPAFINTFYNKLKEIIENNPQLFNVVNSINDIFKHKKMDIEGVNPNFMSQLSAAQAMGNNINNPGNVNSSSSANEEILKRMMFLQNFTQNNPNEVVNSNVEQNNLNNLSNLNNFNQLNNNNNISNSNNDIDMSKLFNPLEQLNAKFANNMPEQLNEEALNNIKREEEENLEEKEEKNPELSNEQLIKNNLNLMSSLEGLAKMQNIQNQANFQNKVMLENYYKQFHQPGSTENAQDDQVNMINMINNNNEAKVGNNDAVFNSLFSNLVNEWKEHNNGNFTNNFKNMFNKDEFNNFQESSNSCFNQVYQDFNKLLQQFGDNPAKSNNQMQEENVNSNTSNKENNLESNNINVNNIFNKQLFNNSSINMNSNTNMNMNNLNHSNLEDFINNNNHINKNYTNDEEKDGQEDNDNDRDDSVNTSKKNMCLILDELKKQFFSIQYYSLLQKLFTSYIFKNLELFVENINKYHSLSEIVSNNILSLSHGKDKLLMNYTHYLKNINIIGSNLSNALNVNLNNLKYNGIKIFNSLEHSLKSNLKTVIDNFEEAYNLIIDDPNAQKKSEYENENEAEMLIDENENDNNENYEKQNNNNNNSNNNNSHNNNIVYETNEHEDIEVNIESKSKSNQTMNLMMNLNSNSTLNKNGSEKVKREKNQNKSDSNMIVEEENTNSLLNNFEGSEAQSSKYNKKDDDDKSESTTPLVDNN